jgi:hypothetical protein
MKVPYATADFATIRRENYFYVDKTQFIALIENSAEKHLVFLRPRRFGKSTLLSTLAYYYDIGKADDFNKLFGGLWIHAHPTPNKNAYLVLRFDFSPVASEGTPEEIRSSFAQQVKVSVRDFVNRHEARVPALSELMDHVRSPEQDVAAILSVLMSIVRGTDHQVYVIIDEYDHFGNRLISDGKMTTYRELVDASGFVRSFYAAIKAFAGTNTVARTFITGVSPIVLDDLSSGFNVITHISQHVRDSTKWRVLRKKKSRRRGFGDCNQSEPNYLDPRIAIAPRCCRRSSSITMVIALPPKRRANVQRDARPVFLRTKSCPMARTLEACSI